MIFNSSKFGFDCSTWQDSPLIAGTVNFQKMKATGAEFVIFRASIGTVPDVDFETYKTNSRGVLPRGVYHFWYNTVTPQAQADALIASIGGEKFEGRVWLDLENKTAGAYNKPRYWQVFCQILESKGYRTGIYTGYYFWQDYAVATGEDLSYFYARPLWQAHYTQFASAVKIAGKWLDMMIWQDGSTGGGYAAGVESPDIDHNQWNDAYNFETEWTTPLPPGEPTMYKYTATALTDGTRLRPAPNVNQTYIGSYPAGTKFSGDVKYIAASPLALNSWVGDVWIEVADINGVAKAGWVAVVHQGKPICSLVENIVTPPTGDVVVTVTVNEQAKTHSTIVKWADGSSG